MHPTFGPPLLQSAWSALSCSPRYPPRITYFSHSLHLSEKDAKLTLNFVLGSPLLIFCIFIRVFISKIRKKNFFSHSSQVWSTLHHQNHSWQSFTSIKSENGFFFCHDVSTNVSNIVFNSIIRYFICKLQNEFPLTAFVIITTGVFWEIRLFSEKRTVREKNHLVSRIVFVQTSHVFSFNITSAIQFLHIVLTTYVFHSWLPPMWNFTRQIRLFSEKRTSSEQNHSVSPLVFVFNITSVVLHPHQATRLSSSSMISSVFHICIIKMSVYLKHKIIRTHVVSIVQLM